MPCCLHGSNMEQDPWYFSEHTRTTFFYVVITLFALMFQFWWFGLSQHEINCFSRYELSFLLFAPSFLDEQELLLLVNVKQRTESKWGSNVIGGRLGVCLVFMQQKHQWISGLGDGLCLCQLEHLGLNMGRWYLAENMWPLLLGLHYANKCDTSPWALVGCAIRNFCSHSLSLLFWSCLK